MTFVGDNENTRLIYYGNTSSLRDGGAVGLGNKNSVLRNLIYEYHPGKNTYYSDAIFQWTKGSVYNVYFDIVGKAGYTYYNSQGTNSNIVKNCTFHFETERWGATSGPTTKYYNIFSNYNPPEGTVDSSLIKDFSNLESTKTDVDIINAQVGVYFGEYAWE